MLGAATEADMTAAPMPASTAARTASLEGNSKLVERKAERPKSMLETRSCARAWLAQHPVDVQQIHLA